MNAFEQEKQRIEALSVETNDMKKIEDVMSIELLLGEYPGMKNLEWAVRFSSKSVFNPTTITYLQKDLFNKQRECFVDLTDRFGITGSEYRDMLDSLAIRKRTDDYTKVPNLYAVIHPCAINEEGVALYQKVSKNILDHIHRYPLQSSNQFQLNDPGLIPDDTYFDKKYGSDVVAVTKKHLLQILGWENSKHRNRLIEIARAWVELGYLIKTSSQPDRLQDLIPIKSIAKAPRFYIISIKNLKNRQTRG